MNASHRGLLTVSFGRLGWQVARMPVLRLTTMGRKSGQPFRSTPVERPQQSQGKPDLDKTPSQSRWIVALSPP